MTGRWQFATAGRPEEGKGPDDAQLDALADALGIDDDDGTVESAGDDEGEME